MLGTFVNALTIIGGSILGLLLGNKISESVKNNIMMGLGICVCFLGFQMALEVNTTMIMIISMVVGILIGSTIKIDEGLNDLGHKLQDKFVSKENNGTNFTEGFISASLVYCVGSMAIIGSLQAGLTQNYDTLFAKSMLDGISAIIFSSTLGISVAFSAIPVLIYQGAITLLSGFIQNIFTDVIIADINGVGGLLIFAIGLNISGIKKVQVGDFLPAIFMPIIIHSILALF